MPSTFCRLRLMFGCTIVIAFQSGAYTAMSQENSVTSLRNESAEVREQAAAGYLNQRHDDIQELLRIVEANAKSLRSSQRIAINSPAALAIKLTGAIRAEAATAPLAQLIAVRDAEFSVVSNETMHWQAFPAAVALSKIGMPAIEPLLQILRMAPIDSTEFQLACMVFESILGKECALAAVKQHGDLYKELVERDRLSAITEQLEIGHQRWAANSAADFKHE